MNVADAPRDQNAPRGERRRVTVLFADMVDFTPTAERLGEEGAYDLMRRIFALMSNAVQEHGGIVETFTGDGIMALFGVPVALEDATLRACKAALLIQSRLAAVAQDFVSAFGVHPQLRIGINTGPVVAGQMEGGRAGVSGDTVNFAARLQSLAAPETVVLSESANQLVVGLVHSEFVGQQKIKGKTEPQNIYRLDAVNLDAVRFDAALSRGLTEYVGRTRELETLEQNLAKAATALCVVDLVAEPGMGKSRLLHEFLQKVDRESIVVLKGNCAPDGAQTGFGLFIDIIRSSFRVASSDDEADIGRKLTDGLSVLGFDSAENHDLLLNLLGLKVQTSVLKGLDGTIIGARTRELLQGLLIARCSRSPTIMVLEDLHWIDSVSEELLGKIIAAVSVLPLFILHTRRPEYRPPWIDPQSQATLLLERLSATETERIVQNRIGSATLPAALAKLVMDRADGNALFAEEITTYLFERGVVRRDGTKVEFDEAAVANTLPPSVQSLLAARVDILEAEDRALLQAASVIGRSFNADVLAKVAKDPRDLEKRLDAISALDFLSFDTRAGEYVFKHALVRDALYESLLSAPRAGLHLNVAEEIERRSDNRLAEVAETLAHHFGKTTKTGKAFFYLSMAGRKSLGSYALAEAGTFLRQAETLLDQAPLCATDDDFADFVTGYILLLQLTYEPKRIVDTAEKYRSRVQQLGDRIEVVVVSHYEIWALIWMLRLREALAVQSVASQIAGRLNTDLSFAYSEADFFFLDAISYKPSPDIDARGKHAIEAALSTGDAYITAWVRFIVGWNAFHRGQILRAHAIAADLAQTGFEMRDSRSTGLALWLQSWTALVSDDYDDALRYADLAIAAGITPFDQSNSQNGRGCALVLLRRADEGMPVLASARAEAAKYERRYEYAGNDLSFGIGLVLKGRFADGVRHIETCIGERRAEGYDIASTWYILGLIQLYLDILYGSEKPPTLIIFWNIRFVLGTMITGRRKALRLLKDCEKNPLLDDSHFMTGILHQSFGRWYLGGKDKENAKLHFKKAKSILERHGDSNVLRKVDQALVALST